MPHLLRFKYNLLFGSIVFFVLAAVMAFISIKEQKKEIEQRHQLARNETARAVSYISTKLQLLESIGISLEKKLEENSTMQSKKLEAILMAKAVENPEIFGVGVAYKPYTFDGKQRLYAPYIKHEAGEPVMIRVEEVYDYTKPEHLWFNLPLTMGKMWQKPYYGQASESMLAEYTFPIYRSYENNRSVVGVGYVNYTLEEMREFLSSMELGKSGYGVILSKEGYVVSHPDEKLVDRRTHLATLAKEHGDKEMMRMVNSAALNKTGELSLVEKATGRKTWVFHQPIPEVGWTFLSVIFEEPTHEAAQKFHRQMIIISLLVLAGLLFGLALLRLILRWGDWTLIAGISILILAEIMVIWNIAVDEHMPKQYETVISDRTMLEKWMDDRRVDAVHHHCSEPRFIPTGVFVENIIQRTGHDIVLSGYLWQQYLIGRDDSLKRGVQFMEITETLSEEFIPLYRYEYGNKEILGWQFRIVVREEYWPLRYPFDDRQIHMRLRHPNFLEGVQLIPDLSSYALLTPLSLPGVDSRIHIPGWEIATSHFEFLTYDYQTSFGAERTHQMSRIDDLSFNFRIEREFLGPFISHLVPMLVVSIMLFALLVMIRRNDKEHLIGFSALEILASTGGLFFVLIIAHSNFRSTSEVPKIIYLENFYFLLYIAIVAITIDALLFITRKDLRFVQYHENLLPKLFYWPVLLGALLAVTVGYFY